MKKMSLSTLSGLFAILFLTNTVQAQNPAVDPPSQNREEIQQRVEEHKSMILQKRQEIKRRIELQRATRQAQLQVARKARIRTFFGRLSTRIKALIARLNILTNRIESRVEDIKENNPETDVSDIEEAIEDARESLTEAEAILEAAEDSLEDALEAEDPKHAFDVIRAEIIEIKEILMEVHLSLVDTIGDIKGLRAGQYE